jgi:DNA-binding transcriptional LysR family regulator
MFDELRAFLLVTEEGTFRGASRAAHLSQPAMSAAIQRLELALGARLFDRGPGIRARRAGAEITGGTSLTAAGHALLPHARAALAAVEDGRRAVREVEGLEAGEARIGGGASACTYLLPDVVARFRALHPQVRLVLREATSDALLAQLAAGDLDLVVAAAPFPNALPFETEPFWNDQLVLVGDRRGGQRVVGRPLVCLPRGSTRSLLATLFPDTEVAVELGSLAAVKEAVRVGAGIALVSLTAVRRDLSTGRLVRLRHPGTPVPRTWHLVHRGEARLSPGTRELRRLLLERPEAKAARRRASSS